MTQKPIEHSFAVELVGGRRGTCTQSFEAQSYRVTYKTRVQNGIPTFGLPYVRNFPDLSGC